MFLKELLESNIKEAKGIFGRTDTDFWTDGDKQWAFRQAVAIPPAQENNGQFESPEARDQWIADFEAGKIPKVFAQEGTFGPIEWTNEPNNGRLAIGLLFVQSTDDNPAGETKIIGRYFQKTAVDLMGKWKNDQLPDGFKLASSKGAAKLDSGLDPQHLIANENQYNSTTSIINTVSKNLEGNPDQKVLVDGLKMAATGQLPTFPGMVESIPVIRDYFSEIMGPVAMMGGLVKGDADQARQELGGGAEWKDMKIFWPLAANYPLVDSVFIAPDGNEIGLSSKGGKGAAASDKNLYDAYEKVKKQAQGGSNSATELLSNVEIAGEIATIIQNNNAKDGPFVLSEKQNLISPKLKTEAENLIDSGATDLKQVSPEAAKLLAPYAWKTDTPGFNVGFALTSAVAKLAAQSINQDPRFSEQARLLLNQASIVQLYTKMGRQGDTARVNSYQAIYPPNFKGRVVLDGGKNYYSSRIGGKFAFKFV